MTQTRPFWDLAVRAGALLAILLVNAFLPGSVSAQEQVLPYIRIEEDWQLIVADPSSDRGGPHIVTQMAPNPSSQSLLSG